MDINADLLMELMNWLIYLLSKPSKKENATGFGKMDFALMARDASFAINR